MDRSLPKLIMWSGIAAILVTGVVHLMTAQDSFDDAAYKGVLFAANGVFSFVAAVGILRGSRTWGWGLGALIAGMSVVAYVASRTVGLPMLPAEPDAWLEPMGVAAMLAELVFLGLYAWVFTQDRKITRTASA